MTTHSGDLVHVHLRVRNVAASRAWYLKTLEPLGFRAVDGPLGSVALGVDVARIWLVPAEQGPVGGALVAIGTAQEGLVDQIGLAAGSHGHMRLTPPRNISVFVNDPDGNTLEVQSGLTAQALAVRSLTTQIPGVLWPAPGNPQRLMTRDRLLVEVTDSAPAIVTSLGGQQARDSELRVEINTTADLEALGPIVAAAKWRALRMTVHSLKKGVQYRVIREFTDYHQQHFVAGETLTFRDANYLPYHDGWTLYFEPRGVWLEGASEVCANLDAYLAEVGPG